MPIWHCARRIVTGTSVLVVVHMNKPLVEEGQVRILPLGELDDGRLLQKDPVSNYGN